MKTQYRATNWCFTDYDKLNWGEIYNDNTKYIRYIGVGDEICPETKREHQQGWIQLHKQKTLNGVKLMIKNKRIHLQACNGNEVSNDKYCQKEGKFKKYGAYVVKGQRVDLEKMHSMLLSGEKRTSDLAMQKDTAKTYYRYRGGFNYTQQLVDKKASEKFRRLHVTVITGPTGCHKTRNAVERNPGAFKIHGDEMEWFDGYDGEKTLIIDEYSNQVKCTKLLGLLDGYQYRLNIKGGFTYARWDKVVITTNLKKLHETAKQCHQDALARRITYWDDRWPEPSEEDTVDPYNNKGYDSWGDPIEEKDTE